MIKFTLPIACFALAGCSMMESDTSYSASDASDGAAFRVEAREVFGRLDPVCPFTRDADQLARYAAMQDRYAQLKDWVGGTPFAVDLAIIEADYANFWASNSVECGPTDTKESIAQMNAELEAINTRLDTLETLAGAV
ncbi:hypothetical protein [Pontixanthobacter sp.]|uniref:hypothetical protein n=1 Tax=Pontixanthobacter sp. TaxID=2792078 RepID=UPI003C7A051C